MPLNRDFLGREFSASEVYEVAREKIRDFALAIGESDPVHLDVAAARAAGHPDLVAPPTFLIVLASRFRADGPLADPELGLDFSLVVHGEQRFVAHRPVYAGDRLRSVQQVTSIRDVGNNELFVTSTEVTSEAGEPVATVVTGYLSRGTAAGAS